jgi:hypothetical protein
MRACFSCESSALAHALEIRFKNSSPLARGGDHPHKHDLRMLAYNQQDEAVEVAIRFYG